MTDYSSSAILQGSRNTVQLNRALLMLNPTGQYLIPTSSTQCRVQPVVSLVGCKDTISVTTGESKSIGKVAPSSPEAQVRARHFGSKGNELAQKAEFTKAIEYYTEAIFLDPNEPRLWGNRSLCYEKLGFFYHALQDSEKALSLKPNWPKGLFRKGKALEKLLRFNEADEVYSQVLEVNKDCPEASDALLRVRVAHLMRQGFTKEQAERALQQYGSVDKALDSLLASRLQNDGNLGDILDSSDDEALTNYDPTSLRDRGGFVSSCGPGEFGTEGPFLSRNAPLSLPTTAEHFGRGAFLGPPFCDEKHIVDAQLMNQNTGHTIPGSVATSSAPSSTFHSPGCPPVAARSQESVLVEFNSGKHYSSPERSEPSESPAQPKLPTIIVKTEKSKQNLNTTESLLTNPKNPLNCPTLWVGNIGNSVNEKALLSLFQKYGKVKSHRLMPDRHCAFINFVDPLSASHAMMELQDAEFSGKNLKLKFPDNVMGSCSSVPKKHSQPNMSQQSPQAKESNKQRRKSESPGSTTKTQPPAESRNSSRGPVQDGECYFYRTTGCSYGDSCKYKHVPKHKGSDYRDWMRR